MELGGSLVHVTTTFAAKALQPNANVYTVALGDDEVSKTSWLELKIKGQTEPLEVKGHGVDPLCVDRVFWPVYTYVSY